MAILGPEEASEGELVDPWLVHSEGAGGGVHPRAGHTARLVHQPALLGMLLRLVAGKGGRAACGGSSSPSTLPPHQALSAAASWPSPLCPADPSTDSMPGLARMNICTPLWANV